MSLEDSLRSLSLDYLNLLINGQAFSDVTFSVEGRLVHAHRCILAARSLFFRKFFCGPDTPTSSGLDLGGARVGSPTSSSSSRAGSSQVIPVNSVGYEVFLLLLQFLYSGQVSIVPQKQEPRPNCGERGCWHTHCTSAVQLALDTLSAARSFGVQQLALLTQVPFFFLLSLPLLPLLIPHLFVVFLVFSYFLGTVIFFFFFSIFALDSIILELKSYYLMWD